MTDTTPDREDAPKPETGNAASGAPRTFLVVVDDSDEMRTALRFACLRARSTQGRVVLMRIIEPPDFEHFKFIGDKMKSEAHGDAEKRLQRLAAEVQKTSGQTPMLVVREGRASEQILKTIEENPEISVLVLAAAKGKDAPGPLVSGLAGTFGSRLRVPVMVVPANLTDADFDRLT
ncbi:universal stress protein [uncultured Rhodospira sp.]|uniref:universal stress protein n=1 Tax=uncultured Rhodospira sp. TaxID=1936189 RepID=UPI002616F503|nr:universal stress protein [uncultured Rhodospira sp.]